MPTQPPENNRPYGNDERRARTIAAINRFMDRHRSLPPEDQAMAERDGWREIQRDRGTATKRENPSEYQEQCNVVGWLRTHAICHMAIRPQIQRGGAAAAREGAMARHMGAQAGVPDLLIVDPPPARPECFETWLEMKRVGGGKPTELQAHWQQLLSMRRGLVLVAYGADDAIKQLMEAGYGNAKG